MAKRSRRSLAIINNGNKPFIGRRTGKVMNIKARLDEFGFEHISDYFTDSDSDNDISIPRRQSVRNSKSVMSSKLNKSKQSANSTTSNNMRNSPVSRRSQKRTDNLPDPRSVGHKALSQPTSQGKPVLSPDKPVSSPEKQVSSPEKPVFSPEKQVASADEPVSSPDKPVALPEKQVDVSDQPVSSSAKQVSSLEKQVSSPNMTVSPSDKQVLTTVGRTTTTPAAAGICDSTAMAHSPPENTNLASTRKKLQFSFANTSLIEEEERLDIQESLTTVKHKSENDEEEYDVRELRIGNKTTAKKLTKSTGATKRRRNNTDHSDNVDEQLTQEVCKSNDTFLTLKSKPNNTIREMLYRSTNSKTVAVEDTPGRPQLSVKNTAVPKNPQTSSAVPKNPQTSSAVPKNSQKSSVMPTNPQTSPDVPKNPVHDTTKSSPQNEAAISTKAPTTKKPNTSKIPVRKRKGPRLTFQDRSKRKSSPKIGKASNDVTPQKARYRKTPAAKSGLRKAETADMETLEAGDFDEGVGDTCNTTFTREEPKKTSKEITSKIPLSQRTTRRKQESVQQQNKENISENGIDENLPAHPESDLSTKPVSVRSVGKKAPISSKRNLRSRKRNKTEAVVENDAEKDSTKNASKKQNSAVGKPGKKQNPTQNKSDASPNVSRESLENQTDSESEASNQAVDSSLAPAPINNTSFSSRSDVDRDSGEVTNEKIVSRKRKLANETESTVNETESTVNETESTVNETESTVKETTKTDGKRGAKAGKGSAKSQGKTKATTSNATKGSAINSEYSSGFSSDDKLSTSAQAAELSSNTVGIPVSTASSESEEVESAIKAPRNKKKRVIPQALEVSDNTGDGLRRSQRNRVPCLQYWKNERIEYERRQSGLVVKDIIVNPTPAPPKRRKRRNDLGQTKKQAKKVLQDKSEDTDESDWSDVEIPDGMEKETDSVATVLDPDTLEEVEMNVVHSGKNLDLKSPNSNGEESNVVDAPLLVDKYFSQKIFGAGQILVRPGAEKGRQHVRRDTMIFHVISGRILFSIHNQGFVVSKGSSFFVPAGNVYNIKNLDTRKNARLIFSQIKNQQ